VAWVVEQNTGLADFVVRTIWFKGYIYAMTQNAGVWRRDGVGPWVQVFVGAVPGAGGGIGWFWEDDDALYCGGGNLNGHLIYRSTDGVAWALDVNLNVAFGLQVSYMAYSAIGGYGSYLYLANHDTAGAGATYFYRRDLAGVWAAFGAAHAGMEGQNPRGVIGYGGEVYWTNATRARYWDGAAWSAESTLDGPTIGVGYMSIVDNELYVGISTSVDLIGRYYWRISSATAWSVLNLEVPNNTWGGWTLNESADGEAYTAVTDGTVIAIHRKTNNHFNMIGYDTPAAGPGTRGGVCVDAAGDMYFGSNTAGTAQFWAWVGVYDLTPGGLYPQAMDCDGDGDTLYIGLYDTATAQPILISVALPLDGALSMGGAVFNPGAGSAINVKCIDVGDRLAISGDFGANEQVEVSDNAGTTWTDIDPGTWGANLAEPLIVDPLTLDEVMVALSALQDIVETTDGGTTWTTLNAALGLNPGAMVLLTNGNEMIIGDDAANVILYSPNRGVTTAVVTGAFVGNVAALEIT
jgi:hypothetical protein